MTEKIFTHIYHTNAWGSKESVSGPTSTLSRTKELLEELPMMIKAIEPTFILDCGCGDFNWMKNIIIGSGIKYTGIDIDIKNTIKIYKKYNQENIFEIYNCDLSSNWDNSNYKIYNLDYNVKYDYIICNFSLMHFSTDIFWCQLDKITKKGSTFVFNLTSMAWLT
jgi:2-polyprenyl-3-methyl-5-hydroxy-6-metoxy-1,4-benzoquinol methylase